MNPTPKLAKARLPIQAQALVLVLLWSLFPACQRARQEATPPPPSPSASSPIEILDITWEALLLREEGITPRVEGGRPYFRLEAGPPARLVGFTGCNRLVGAWTLEGDSIRFSRIATTRMACGGPDLEAAFLEVLNTADRATLVQGQLILLAGHQPLAVFGQRKGSD